MQEHTFFQRIHRLLFIHTFHIHGLAYLVKSPAALVHVHSRVNAQVLGFNSWSGEVNVAVSSQIRLDFYGFYLGHQTWWDVEQSVSHYIDSICPVVL